MMAGKVLVWTVCILAIISNGECASRQKRSVFQFGQMIRCATGRDPLDYNNYGCHCGFGGKVGQTQVDATDSCCYNHDRCYSRMKRSCPFLRGDVYLPIYKFTQYSCGTPYPQITCGKAMTSACKIGLCNCDREAALCFKKSIDSFPSEEYEDYDRC